MRGRFRLVLDWASAVFGTGMALAAWLHGAAPGGVLLMSFFGGWFLRKVLQGDAR